MNLYIRAEKKLYIDELFLLFCIADGIIVNQCKQMFNLMHELANRWHTVSKIVIFTFLALPKALKDGTIEVGKMKNQMTNKRAPLSGEILN